MKRSHSGLKRRSREKLDWRELENVYARIWNAKMQLDHRSTKRRVHYKEILDQEKERMLTSESLNLPSTLRRREAGAGRWFLLAQLEGALVRGVERCLRSMSNTDRPKGV